MTPAQRAEALALRAYPLINGADAVPPTVLFRVCREIRAGAPRDAVLLLADQVRAIAEHLRLLGAERAAARYRDFAALILQDTETAP